MQNIIQKARDWIYRRMNLILFLIALGFGAEMLCIKYKKGFAVLDETSADLLYGFCLSIVAAYLFYLLVVRFPEKRNSYYRRKPLYFILLAYCDNIDMLLAPLTHEEKVPAISEETSNKIKPIVKVINKHYRVMDQKRQYIDSKTMLSVDSISVRFAQLGLDKDLAAGKLAILANFRNLPLIFSQIKTIRREERKSLALARRWGEPIASPNRVNSKRPVS
jgi:hypothetical protein